jgi:hypothetical protein
LASEGVTAAEFGDGSTFDYAALNFTGAQYGGDPSPEFSVTPAYTAPGNFVPAASYSYNFDGVHYGGDPTPEFTVSPYTSPGNYNSLPYAFNQYALTLTHSVPSYSLSTPATFNVTRFEWPGPHHQAELHRALGASQAVALAEGDAVPGDVRR